MAILFVGIDLAKNVFAIHGVDEHGKAVLVRPSVQRARLHQLVSALPPCTIAMEACSGAHHWARLFAQTVSAVRLMAPKFVTPYRMSGKTRQERRRRRGGDLRGGCAAEHALRPGQERRSAGACCACTGCAKATRRSAPPPSTGIRGLLSEFGIVFAQSPRRCARPWRR